MAEGGSARGLDAVNADQNAVLAEVDRLRKELSLGSSPCLNPLSETFDHMGLGSLDRNELVSRLEDRFGVSLPTDVLGWVETPQDLVRAVHTSPKRRIRVATPRLPMIETRDDESGRPAGTSLPEVLDWHVARHPDRCHITLLDESTESADISYGQLRESATAVAAGLIDLGVAPGDSVALVLPTGRSYFETFFGVLLAGAVPVPLYPPARRSQLAEHLRRQQGILDNSKAAVLVTVPEARSLGRVLRAQVPSLRSVVVAADLAAGGSIPYVAREPGDAALVQYTSGSTGDPKGVVLTHDNLLSNIWALADNAAAQPADVFVSWLPLYHDMGLIGAWLTSMTVGMRLAVMSPVTFLRRPSDWLWAIHEQGGTISGGPNFAYARCTAKISDAEIEGLDLSSWRLAFNGAEPVSADTLEGFARRFGRYGFSDAALMPVYGLAEASVGLTFPPPGRGPVIDRIDREQFVRSRIAAPVDAEHPDALRVVSCGQPLAGHDVRVVDVTGAELPERSEGQIEFRGPSATSGYLRNPQATRALFNGDWLDTGDLGYFVDRDLYVTGRVKDMIISAGRNIHPAELEEAVGAVPGVRAGCVAVFGDRGPAGGGERLVVLAETRVTDGSARAELHEQILTACVDLVDVAPDEVVLVEPGTVPKTSSGKIRRGAAQALWANNALHASSTKKSWQLAQVTGRVLLTQVTSLGRRARTLAWSAYAWAMWLLIASLVMAALFVVPTVRWRRRATQLLLQLFTQLVAVTVVLEHPDRLPDQTSVIVANHASMIDALVLGVALPSNVTFVGSRDYADQHLTGFVMRRLGARHVDRAGGAQGILDVERLVGALRRGETLVMFPEGQLEPGRRLGVFHLGAFAAAVEAQVPITAITSEGTDQILAPRQRVIRRGDATLHVNEPLQPTGNDWAAAVALRRTTRNVMMGNLLDPR